MNIYAHEYPSIPWSYIPRAPQHIHMNVVVLHTPSPLRIHWQQLETQHIVTKTQTHCLLSDDSPHHLFTLSIWKCLRLWENPFFSLSTSHKFSTMKFLPTQPLLWQEMDIRFCRSCFIFFYEFQIWFVDSLGRWVEVYELLTGSTQDMKMSLMLKHRRVRHGLMSLSVMKMMLNGIRWGVPLS